MGEQTEILTPNGGADDTAFEELTLVDESGVESFYCVMDEFDLKGYRFVALVPTAEVQKIVEVEAATPTWLVLCVGEDGETYGPCPDEAIQAEAEALIVSEVEED